MIGLGSEFVGSKESASGNLNQVHTYSLVMRSRVEIEMGWSFNITPDASDLSYTVIWTAFFLKRNLI
jgi:hypothetical protein